MNEIKTTVTQLDAKSVHRASDLIDFLIVMAKHKKLLFLAPLAAGVIAAGVSFILPDIYKANTKLLPPQQSQSEAAALLSQLGGVAGSLAAAGIKNPNDLYVGMLKSRTVADKLIERYNIKKIYQADTLEKTRRLLEENTIITSAKDGMIAIEVEDEDRSRVAQIANGYVEELLKLTKILAVTEASQRRMFFEQQLALSKDNLAKAEFKFNSALDTHGVISVDANSRAILETVGHMRAQIAAKEIQLNSMRAFVTADNNEYKRVQEELNSSRAELSKLQNGRPAVDIDKSIGVKQAGLENMQILRNVKYHQMLYELLAKQYEAARLDEAKDASIIQVLDVATESERKFKPRRSVIIITSSLVALFAALLWAFILEGKRKAMQEPERAARWEKLCSYF